MIQAGHAIELRLNGHGDLALHFLSGPAGVLGNDFDRRWRRIGIGLDIEHFKGIQASDEEHHRQRNYYQSLTQNRIDQLTNHPSSSILCPYDPARGPRSNPPSAATGSPSCAPERIFT